jgi:hypothetical protein
MNKPRGSSTSLEQDIPLISKGKSMEYRSKRVLFAALLLAGMFMLTALLLSATQLLAQIPQAIVVPGETPAAFLHAEGAQIYQCQLDSRNKLTWQLREPIATLIFDGNTVGRHYGSVHWEHPDPGMPRWDHNDGSSVKAQVVARAPGAMPDDVPWLKLRVISQTGDGAFYGVTSVQRVNTRGGMAQGDCDKADSYLSVPYSADYLFWRQD